MTTTYNKTKLATAIYNYLQTGRYAITSESCGSFSKDDETIEQLIDLSELTQDQVTEILEDNYLNKVAELKDVTISGMARAISIDLCGAWIYGRKDITIGYDHSNKYHEGLRVGESTMFMIA